MTGEEIIVTFKEPWYNDYTRRLYTQLSELIIMDELKNQLAQYLCSQIHNGTKDLIELIESEDLINEQWYKNWKEEMRILLQEK